MKHTIKPIVRKWMVLEAVPNVFVADAHQDFFRFTSSLVAAQPFEHCSFVEASQVANAIPYEQCNLILHQLTSVGFPAQFITVIDTYAMESVEA